MAEEIVSDVASTTICDRKCAVRDSARGVTANSDWLIAAIATP
jgi:hypothetical protein